MPKLKPEHINPAPTEDRILSAQAQEDDTDLPDTFWANAKTIDHFPELQNLVGKRGKQKTPTKQPVTIRLSPEVVAYFKATGKGWQSRINDVLMKHIS